MVQTGLTEVDDSGIHLRGRKEINKDEWSESSRRCDGGCSMEEVTGSEGRTHSSYLGHTRQLLLQ
jgi:hypothetical protein